MSCCTRRDRHKSLTRVWSAIAESGQVERIIETGSLDDDHELSRLYSGASAFVFPTHYDSFGFPILEAMAYGAPVIASTLGATYDAETKYYQCLKAGLLAYLQGYARHVNQLGTAFYVDDGCGHGGCC